MSHGLRNEPNSSPVGGGFGDTKRTQGGRTAGAPRFRNEPNFPGRSAGCQAAGGRLEPFRSLTKRTQFEPGGRRIRRYERNPRRPHGRCTALSKRTQFPGQVRRLPGGWRTAGAVPQLDETNPIRARWAADSEIRKEPKAAARPVHGDCKTNPISRAGPPAARRPSIRNQHQRAFTNPDETNPILRTPSPTPGQRQSQPRRRLYRWLRNEPNLPVGSRRPAGRSRKNGRLPVSRRRDFPKRTQFRGTQTEETRRTKRTQCRRPSTTFSKRTQFPSSAGGRHDVCETNPMRAVRLCMSGRQRNGPGEPLRGKNTLQSRFTTPVCAFHGHPRVSC